MFHNVIKTISALGCFFSMAFCVASELPSMVKRANSGDCAFYEGKKLLRSSSSRNRLKSSGSKNEPVYPVSVVKNDTVVARHSFNSPVQSMEFQKDGSLNVELSGGQIENIKL